MITLSRRKLLGGLGLLIAAPAIVKASSLMPVKAYVALEPVSQGVDGVFFLNGDAFYYVNTTVKTLTWSHTSDLDSWEPYHEVTEFLAAEPISAGQPVVLR